MMQRLHKRLKGRYLLALAFALALLVTAVFAARLVVVSVYWSDPAHQDEQIAGWMTPRYVAHSWRVPPEVLWQAIGLSGQDGSGPRRLTFFEISAEQGLPLPDLLRLLDDAIAEYRAAQP